MLKPIVCLMGPTASGKTPLAINLLQYFPFEIISVDSVQVYRGMDIGTAKPSPEVLAIAPHHLIDICDPAHAYSAGQFRQDALVKIEDIFARNKIPLLVGGTMMYFRILTQGLASLPKADPPIRAALALRGELEGWPELHAYLAQIDPQAANRIHERDAQRIQRALEVYELTGKTITEWQKQDTNPLLHYDIHYIALTLQSRADLHDRIKIRFDEMLKHGFVEEVRKLYERGDLQADLPSIRSVGYRQMWDYFAGKMSYDEMRERSIAATRQLAKRQLTWLRPWPNLQWYDSNNANYQDKVKIDLSHKLKTFIE